MQIIQKKAWEKRLRASVSVAVLCFTVPNNGLAASSDSLSPLDIVFPAKIATNTMAAIYKPYKRYPVAQLVLHSASYMPDTNAAKEAFVAEQRAKIDKLPRRNTLSVARQATADHEPAIAQAETGTAYTPATAVSLPWLAQANAAAPTDSPPLVLRPPVHQPNPAGLVVATDTTVWREEKGMHVSTAAPAIRLVLTPPHDYTQVVQRVALKPEEMVVSADEEPHYTVEKNAGLSPLQLAAPSVVVTSQSIPESIARPAALPVAAPAPHLASAIAAKPVRENSAHENTEIAALTLLQLTAPATERAAAETVAMPVKSVETKTLLDKVEIASQQTIEPVITGRAFSELEVMAQMSPAAGEQPTILMPPKAPLVNEPPVQKLNLPGSMPVSEPDAVNTIVPPDHEKEPRLSEESKGILERLPPEPKQYSGTSRNITIDRGAKASLSKDEKVRKHEAYGLKIAIKRPKMDVFRSLESAYNALIAGDQQYAITQYKEVLDEDPENTLALFGLATTYHRAGQVKMARPLYAQLLEIDPQNVEGLNNFLVLLADESPRDALIELEKLQRTHPSFSPVPAQMALIYEKEGDYSKAAEKMARALSITPENIKYQYDMAIIYDKMGDWTEAAKWYQQLLSADARGEKIPGKMSDIQQRLTFIRNNTGSHHS